MWKFTIIRGRSRFFGLHYLLLKMLLSDRARSEYEKNGIGCLNPTRNREDMKVLVSQNYEKSDPKIERNSIRFLPLKKIRRF